MCLSDYEQVFGLDQHSAFSGGEISQPSTSLCARKGGGEPSLERAKGNSTCLQCREKNKTTGAPRSSPRLSPNFSAGS